MFKDKTLSKCENICYYLSCMLLFNSIFLVREMVNLLRAHVESILGIFLRTPVGIICAINLVVGMWSTWRIIKTDCSISSKASLGDRVKIVKIEEVTEKNYFTHYSLLVLTGLALPVGVGLEELILYLLIVITLGILYTRKNMVYINPLLSLFEYNVYDCEVQQVLGSDADGKSKKRIYLTHAFKLECGDILQYQNTARRVIRLNNPSCKEQNEGE